MSIPYARTLPEIAAAALLADCGRGDCWARPGVPCGGRGTHIERYQRARRRGLLSAADMTAVMASVIASMVPVSVTAEDGRAALCTTGSSPRA